MTVNKILLSNYEKYQSNLYYREATELTQIYMLFYSILDKFIPFPADNLVFIEDTSSSRFTFPLYQVFKQSLLNFYKNFKGKLLLQDKEINQLVCALEKATHKGNAKELEKDIENGKLTIIPGGWPGHRINLVFHKDVYGIGNAGQRYSGMKTIELFQVNPKYISETMLDEVEKVKNKMFSKAEEYIYVTIPEMLQWDETHSQRTKLLEEAGKKLSPKDQKSGSCMIKSIKVAIRIAWYCLAEKGKENSKELYKRVVKETQAYFDFTAISFLYNHLKNPLFKKIQWEFLNQAVLGAWKKESRLNRLKNELFSIKRSSSTKLESPAKRVKITPATDTTIENFPKE